MKAPIYKSYEDLPLYLNAETNIREVVNEIHPLSETGCAEGLFSRAE